MQKPIGKKTKLILYVIAAIEILVMLYFCLKDDIWTDEIYSIGFAKNRLSDLWTYSGKALDTSHPPLYYTILKLIAQPFGYSLTACKIASLLPIILMMTVSARKINEISILSGGGGITFSSIVGAFPSIFFYSSEIRMYSWAMFFVTETALYAYAAYRNKKKSDYIGMTVFAVLSAYTHYYALLSAVYIYLFMLVADIIKDKKQVKYVLLSGVIVLAVYIPWLRILLGQIHDTVNYGTLSWIEQPTIDNLLGVIMYIFNPYKGKLALLIICTLFAAILIIIKKHEEYKRILTEAGLISCVLLSAFIISLTITPVLINRYMVVVSGIAVILIYDIITKSDKKMCILIAITMLLSYAGAIYGQMKAIKKDPTIEMKREFNKRIPDENANLVFSAEELNKFVVFSAMRLSWLYPNNDVYVIHENSTEKRLENMLENYKYVHSVSEIPMNNTYFINGVDGIGEDIDVSYVDSYINYEIYKVNSKE